MQLQYYSIDLKTQVNKTFCQEKTFKTFVEIIISL